MSDKGEGDFREEKGIPPVNQVPRPFMQGLFILGALVTGAASWIVAGHGRGPEEWWVSFPIYIPTTLGGALLWGVVIGRSSVLLTTTILLPQLMIVLIRGITVSDDSLWGVGFVFVLLMSLLVYPAAKFGVGLRTFLSEVRQPHSTPD